MKINGRLFLCAIGLTTVGCAMTSEPESSPEETVDEARAALSTVAFSGTVKNEQGVAVTGATIVINGVTKTTDAAGKYFYSVLSSANGYRISVTKAGFAPIAEFASASKINQPHTLKAAYVQQINPTQDNTVIAGSGAKVTIKANSLVDKNGVLVSGPVNVSIATYDPLRMPGDFTAVNTANQQVALESVGAIDVSATLVSSSAALQIKPGGSVSAFIPVPAAVGGMPSCVSGGTCRLAMWRFDTLTGKWQERAASMQSSASGTTFTMTGSGGASLIPDNGGLGVWNADLEMSSPACTIIEFVGIPLDCYHPPGVTTEPGITIKTKLPNASIVFVDKTETVSSATAYVALYNSRANAIQEVGIAFPEGAPSYCAGNLQIESIPPPATLYPMLSAAGGATRFNSGAPWGGTGYPKKANGSLITAVDVGNDVMGDETDNTQPCKSRVQFYTSEDPVPQMKSAMTWSLLNSATSGSSNAYALVGSDAVTNPYQGDTWTSNTLPVLCINKNNPVYPGAGVIGSPGQTPGGAWRRTWSGGTVALTAPVKGTSLTSLAVADALCASEFGAGYRFAEFHDGDPTLWSGWDFWGAALNANISPFQGTRFWVSINDQNANPW